MPTGKGTVVGIADWGFDFTHPNFRNKDGSTRFIGIWNQGDEYDQKNKYGYGRIISRQEINDALQSDNPFETINYYPAINDSGTGSHGTHVLDIAAGNGTVGAAGLASEAELIAVQLSTVVEKETFSLGEQGRLLESIDYMHLNSKQKPLVINLSVGSHGGPHNGLTLIEQGFDRFLETNNNRALVQSAGNYFQARCHKSGRIKQGQEEKLSWFVNKKDATQNELEIWYSGADEFKIELKHAKLNLPIECLTVGKTDIETNDGAVIGKIYHRKNEPNSGLNHIDIFLYPDALPGLWTVNITGYKIKDGRYHSWIERDGSSLTSQSYFANNTESKSSTIGTICNGFLSIAVGAYNDHIRSLPLAPFSSSGPTMDGRVKPELVAPGYRIQAAKSSPRNTSKSRGELTTKSGTSMASPFVTGALASTLEEATSDVSIYDIRERLLNSLDTSRAKNQNRIGNGYLNLEKLYKNKFNQQQKMNYNEILNRYQTRLESLNIITEVLENYQKISRSIAIWETNRGGNTPLARQSSLDTVCGVKASVRSVGQYILIAIASNARRFTSLRSLANPNVTGREILNAEAQIRSLNTLLRNVNTAFDNRINVSNFITSNQQRIASLSLTRAHINLMFAGARLERIIRGYSDQVDRSSRARTRATAREFAQQIREEHRLGMGVGSLTSYIRNPRNWGENRAAWHRLMLSLQPNRIGQRLEEIGEHNNGLSLLEADVQHQMQRIQSTNPSITTENLVKSIARNHNPNAGAAYSNGVWSTYSRLYNN